jgi:hypothetical protein
MRDEGVNLLRIKHTYGRLAQSDPIVTPGNCQRLRYALPG